MPGRGLEGSSCPKTCRPSTGWGRRYTGTRLRPVQHVGDRHRRGAQPTTAATRRRLPEDRFRGSRASAFSERPRASGSRRRSSATAHHLNHGQNLPFLRPPWPYVHPHRPEHTGPSRRHGPATRIRGRAALTLAAGGPFQPGRHLVGSGPPKKEPKEHAARAGSLTGARPAPARRLPRRTQVAPRMDQPGLLPRVPHLQGASARPRSPSAAARLAPGARRSAATLAQGTRCVGRRDEPHLMAQLADLATPECAPPQASIVTTQGGS